MIDELLYAVVGTVQLANLGYDAQNCRVVPEGRPPADTGEWFLGVHQGADASSSMNSLDESLGYQLTLTKRVNVPLDRVGDLELAVKIASTPGPNRQPSFNRRCRQLIDILHMDWATLGSANDLLAQWGPPTTAYGACEPAHFATLGEPRLEGPGWFLAADGQGGGTDRVGLVATIHYEGCRRVQPLVTFAE